MAGAGPATSGRRRGCDPNVTGSPTAIILAVSVFAACAVEAVEAVTIVLAVGLTRGWRATRWGITAALVVLAVITGALGPAVERIPLTALRLVIGTLLCVFGLQWLRKAVLRASGHKALHDEEKIFARERTAAIAAAGGHGPFDPYSFTVAFKGVLLEGLEVVFIVVTFGANSGHLPTAVVAALAAVALVSVAAVAVRAPLARVPENTLKFAVGVMLTAYGSFWGAEGAGVHWPGGDAAILALVGLYALASLGYVRLLRRRSAPIGVAAPASPARPR